LRTGFWWGYLKDGDHMEHLGVDGRIILKLIFNKRNLGGLNWIDMVLGRDRWRAFVNAAMNLRVP